MRISNFEFRRNGDDRLAEIVAWEDRENEKPYCYTVVFFYKDKEGYYLKSVGDRILVEDYDTLHKLIKYAFTVLNAEFELMEIDYI